MATSSNRVNVDLSNADKLRNAIVYSASETIEVELGFANTVHSNKGDIHRFSTKISMPLKLVEPVIKALTMALDAAPTIGDDEFREIVEFGRFVEHQPEVEPV